MRQSVYKKTTIEVAGYTAEVNIKFYKYNSGYYTSVSETAKAIKALAKAAGFNVLGCKSKSYSGGDSVDLYVETELTPEQQADNVKNRDDVFTGRNSIHHIELHKEPRENLLRQICGHFSAGSFDGMQDLYEYRKDGSKIKDPEGNDIELDAKYTFWHIMTKEEHARWYK